MIETIYRGHTIRYTDNADEWTCYDVQDAKGQSYSSPKLSNVKAAIDKMFLDMRKRSAFPCFELGKSHHPTKTAATIIEYVEHKIERNFYRPTEPSIDRHVVAAVAQRTGRERAVRRTADITEFMPDTPEAHEAYQRFLAARQRAQEAEKDARDAFDAIPRVSIDMIPDLVRIKNSETGAGE